MVWTLKNIFVDILKLLSAILMLVFVLGKIPSFRRMFYKKPSTTETVLLAVFFGFLGILGTYGFPLEQATANTRAVAVIVGGLVAGPAVGLGAGLIAGIHRYLLGGLTAEAALLSVILQGILAGKYFEMINRRVTWPEGIALGAFLEIAHFCIVLAITRPFHEALSVVILIAPPMIFVNSIGVVFFLLMLDSTIGEQKAVADFTISPAQKQVRGKNLLILRLEDKTIVVNQSNVFFIKAIGQKKTVVFTTKGNHETNFTLKDIETKLDPEKFLRTHKSFVVNMERISEIIPWFSSTYLLVLEGCSERDVPVSRYYMKEFNKQMGIMIK